jgi:low temperature requirement protein LtrA
VSGRGAAVVDFFILAALELLVPVWAERSGPMTSWHPGHIAERYGLFTIIVLGESIFAAFGAVQTAISVRGWSGSLLLLGASGLVIVFLLWWTYFARSADDGLRRTRGSAFVWGYGHYVVFASGAAVGAGLQVAAAVSSVGGLPGNLTAAYAVAAPVACYLLVLGVLHTRLDPGRPVLLASLLKAGVVLAAAATAAVFSLTTSLLLVALALAGSVAATALARAPGGGRRRAARREPIPEAEPRG